MVVLVGETFVMCIKVLPTEMKELHVIIDSTRVRLEQITW